LKCEFVNSVIHALKETLVSLSSEFDKIEIKDIFIKDEMFTQSPVVVKIKFGGGLNGMVVMSMDLQTAVNLADLLLVADGSYAEGFTDIAQSSIKEVANMFAGQVAMLLSDGRPEINIQPPQLSFGKKFKVSSFSCPFPSSLFLNIPAGLLEMDISLTEVEREKQSI